MDNEMSDSEKDEMKSGKRGTSVLFIFEHKLKLLFKLNISKMMKIP